MRPATSPPVLHVPGARSVPTRVAWSAGMRPSPRSSHTSSGKSRGLLGGLRSWTQGISRTRDAASTAGFSGWTCCGWRWSEARRRERRSDTSPRCWRSTARRRFHKAASRRPQPLTHPRADGCQSRMAAHRCLCCTTALPGRRVRGGRRLDVRERLPAGRRAAEGSGDGRRAPNRSFRESSHRRTQARPSSWRRRGRATGRWRGFLRVRAATSRTASRSGPAPRLPRAAAAPQHL